MLCHSQWSSFLIPTFILLKLLQLNNHVLLVWMGLQSVNCKSGKQIWWNKCLFSIFFASHVQNGWSQITQVLAEWFCAPSRLIPCTADKTKLLVNSICQTVPKSLFWVHGCLPSGLEKKTLEFQLVLWVISSHISLAWGHFSLILVNDFVCGWFGWNLALWASKFKSHLPSKKIYQSLTTGWGYFQVSTRFEYATWLAVKKPL